MWTLGRTNGNASPWRMTARQGEALKRLFGVVVSELDHADLDELAFDSLDVSIGEGNVRQTVVPERDITGVARAPPVATHGRVVEGVVGAVRERRGAVGVFRLRLGVGNQTRVHIGRRATPH